jgi:hypothetical protein
MYWPNQKMIHFPQMSSTLFIYGWQADGPCSLFKAGSSKGPDADAESPDSHLRMRLFQQPADAGPRIQHAQRACTTS